MFGPAAETDEYVTVKLPKRYAAVLEANMEMGTSQKRLKLTIGAFRTFSVALFSLAAFCVAVTLIGLVFLPGPNWNAIAWAFIGILPAAFGYLLWRSASATKRAYKARGLI